jgi:hypothetical protein
MAVAPPTSLMNSRRFMGLIVISEDRGGCADLYHIVELEDVLHHSQTGRSCPQRVKSCISAKSLKCPVFVPDSDRKPQLFDHLVGTGLQRLRYG